MKVLVTGGAGYIGSHFVKYLLDNSHSVTVIDNLDRGHREAVDPRAGFVQADIMDFTLLKEAVENSGAEAVVHFAAFAYVGESVEKPELYYANNVTGSLNLIKAVVEAGINKFVFSSTCSLYGNPDRVPISEDTPTNPINPYANTKLMIEIMLRDFEQTYGLKSVCLRYFNAAGADPSGSIGESHDPEPHLIPIVLQAALGKREKVFIFGDDYDTPDGTCIRDYIHVNDLADAHLKAIEYLSNGGKSNIINLGTGEGYSVKEIIETAINVTGKEIKYEIAERRPGDPARLVADNSKALNVLGWNPVIKLEQIIENAWNWHKNQRY